MSDTIKEFEGLDYPGKREPVNRGKRKAVPDTPVWDERPVHYLVGGERQEFFTISHLSKALEYSQQSIRAWEAQGLLARTPFRSPRTKGMVAAGRSNKGKRLWTREQIEGIIRIAKKHRVIFPIKSNGKEVKRAPTPAFAVEVGEFFSTLIK